MSQIERRFIPATEIRAETEGESRRIAGYAALFNSRSQDLGGFTEVIAPGAFQTALERSDVRSLFNHDPNLVLGRMKAGTLKVTEDERGLRIENDLPDTQVARDLLENMRLGNVDQMSFAFRVSREGQKWEERDGMLLRTITEVDELFDVSPVTYPAYADTSVAVRSLDAWRAEMVRGFPAEDAERILRMKSWRRHKVLDGTKHGR